MEMTLSLVKLLQSDMPLEVKTLKITSEVTLPQQMC
jgi:hypothetical protein